MTDCVFFEVCGIDGAGKSSILEQLQAEHIPSNAAFMRRTDRRDGRLISKYFRRKYGDYRDWTDPVFANNWGICGIYDFLNFYETEVLTRRKDKNFIVFDRYTTSAWAYAAAYGMMETAGRLLDSVQQPDLILYVHADMDIVLDRYEKRGARGDDEEQSVMSRYRDGFEKVLPVFNDKVVRIDNSGPFEHTMQSVRQAISTFALE